MIKDRNFDPYNALLDADEQDIVESFEKGEWKTVDDFKEQAILAQQTAVHSLKKDKRINIHVLNHGFYRYSIITLISMTQNFIFASNKEIAQDITDPLVKLSSSITEDYNKTTICLEKNFQSDNNNSERLLISGSKISSSENIP